jgi:hypothetical protein
MSWRQLLAGGTSRTLTARKAGAESWKTQIDRVNYMSIVQKLSRI